MGRAAGARAVLRAVALTAVTVSPVFLVGSTAVQMRHDVDLGPAGIGVAAAVMFGVGGLLAPVTGAVVERAGPRVGMAGAAFLSSVALLGVALSSDFGGIVAALALAGAANALGQPATNMGLSRAVVPHRLGTALGAKQASIPTASLLGGLADPVVALALGWRWVFVSAAALALLVAVWNGTRALTAESRAAAPRAAEPLAAELPAAASLVPEHPARPRGAGTSRLAMVLFSGGGGLAAAAATSLGIFLVDSAVSSGFSHAAAGIAFAGAATVGLFSRIGAGVLIDARPQWSPYLLVAVLLVVGAAGFGFLAVGSLWGIVAGALFAYGAGWAWPGLMHYGVVRASPGGVGRATGQLQIGLSLGAAFGPLAFGLLSEAQSYAAAWIAAGVGLAGAAAVIAGGHAVNRRRRP